jgi:hypothetical protein
MRTKTLILTAALSAAGVATSMAQVYSVNAVGYVNTKLAPGLNLISNPLIATDNTIGGLFKDLPDGTQVFKFTGSGFGVIATKDITFDPPAAAATTVMPGEGVFVKNPTSGELTVTFVGEVPQGALHNDLPKGLAIRSSMVPQAGTAEALGLPGADGDQLFQWTGTGYYISTYDAGWDPALKPLKVGEAFFIKKANAASWDRNFSVNTP